MNSDVPLAGKSKLHQVLLRSPPALANNRIPPLLLEMKDLLPPPMTPFPAEALHCPGSPNEIFNRSISIPATDTHSAPWRLLTQV